MAYGARAKSLSMVRVEMAAGWWEWEAMEEGKGLEREKAMVNRPQWEAICASKEQVTKHARSAAHGGTDSRVAAKKCLDETRAFFTLFCEVLRVPKTGGQNTLESQPTVAWIA